MARLETAFKSQGIQLIQDEDVQRCLRLGLPKQMSYALYTENVTAEEILALLQKLHAEDRKAEVTRRESSQFDGLVVSRMSPADHQLLCRLLRVRPEQLETIRPKATSRGVDIRKHIAVSTADEIVRNLKGQGGLQRPQSGKPASRAPERFAVAVTCNRAPVKGAMSAEVQRFLDSRQERRTDTLQMLLVLRGKN
jgi:hypothetical protein